MIEQSVVTVFGLVLLGCGDDAPQPCYVELYQGSFGERSNNASGECIAALRFAARDTATIIPSQEDANRYFERWSRAVTAEPILGNRVPQRYRPTLNDLVADILTTNPTIIASLSASSDYGDVPRTGEPAFDDVVHELVRPKMLHGPFDLGNGVIEFQISSAAPFNEELLHTRLLPTSSGLPEPRVEHKDDGTWTWLERGRGVGDDTATAQIDFTFGWGDCFVGCQGFHDLRAIVPPTDPAVVYDMGGDPLPPNLILSPDTLPPP